MTTSERQPRRVYAKVAVDTVAVVAGAIMEVKLLVTDVVVDEPLDSELDQGAGGQFPKPGLRWGQEHDRGVVHLDMDHHSHHYHHDHHVISRRISYILVLEKESLLMCYFCLSLSV